MKIYHFIIIGACLLAWSVVLSALRPYGTGHLIFIYAGLVLLLAPIYTKIRIEKNNNGFKVYVDMPSVPELTERDVSLHKIKLESLAAEKEIVSAKIELSKTQDKNASNIDEIKKEDQSSGFGAIFIILIIFVSSWYLFKTPENDPILELSPAEIDLTWQPSIY